MLKSTFPLLMVWMSLAAGLVAAIFYRRYNMKSVLKCLFVFAVLMLVVVTAYTFIVLLPVSRQAVLRPILSVCMLVVIGYIATRNSANFTKRFTTATGIG